MLPKEVLLKCTAQNRWGLEVMISVHFQLSEGTI